MPNDLPRWHTVYRQTERCIQSGVFATIVADMRELLRLAGGRKGLPSPVIFDSRTLQSTPESGRRAAYDRAKRRKGSETHIAVDTLGHLLALLLRPADQRDRDQVSQPVPLQAIS